MTTDYFGKFTVSNSNGCVNIDFHVDPKTLTDQDWKILFELSQYALGKGNSNI